jgi:hypothetical protein
VLARLLGLRRAQRPCLGLAVTLLENGDKIFAEFSGAVQTVVGPDGSKKTTATTVHKLTGPRVPSLAAFGRRPPARAHTPRQVGIRNPSHDQPAKASP